MALVDKEATNNEKAKTLRKIRAILGDAYTFVRSMEANRDLESVTMEELMEEQILRNGERDASNMREFNPYTYESGGETPAGQDPPRIGNFISGTDAQNPTKLDRVEALGSVISGTVSSLKQTEPEDIADVEDYIDAEDEIPPY